jgi:hypothetical protein
MQIRRDDGNENGREAAQEELARNKNLRVQSRKEQFFGKAFVSSSPESSFFRCFHLVGQI